jgi:hypothetical protein
MKTVSLLLLVFILSFRISPAQKPVTVLEDSLKVARSYIPGLSVLIPEADYEVVLKDWIKVLQSNTKSKAANQNGEVSIFGARTKDIKEEPFNVYSKLLNHDSLIYLVAAFELTKDKYIERESTSDAFTRAKKFIKEFAVGEYTDVAKNQMDAEDKKLKEAEKELSSLENEHSKLQKSIESNKSDIISEKENIVIQKNELDLVSSNINEQRSLLNGMDESDAKKEKNAFIKELEKRKKKAQNSIDSSEKKIKKAETEITNATALIPENEMNQDKARQKVTSQEIIYQKFVEKFKKIKAY